MYDRISKSSLPLQAKLTVGPQGDKYEQEADRVAAEVVQRIHSPQASWIQPPTGDGNEIQMQRMVAQQPGSGGNLVSAELEAEINGARGQGRPLDAGLQQSMRQAMGADFSGVRVHTDAQSDQLNRSIQSRAFTTGRDVFFRQGEYQPRSRGGQALIAHELAHVVQQGGIADQCQWDNNSEIKHLDKKHTIQRDVYKENSSNAQTVPPKAKQIAKWVTRKASVQPGGRNHIDNVHNRSLAGFKKGKEDQYVGGRVFNNNPMPDRQRLPYSKGQTYKEWDVNPSVQGERRDTERVVTSSNGKAYYTNDHYANFTEFSF